MGGLIEPDSLEAIMPAGAVLLYHAMIHDWSWGAELAVWESDGKLYAWDGGPGAARLLSQDEALAEMIEFDAAQADHILGG